MFRQGERNRFSGARLRLARQFRGLTQAQLGVRASVSHTFIGYVESNRKEPGEIAGRAIGDALGFHRPFFGLPDPPQTSASDWYFRRRRSTAVAVRTRATAQATLFGELLDVLEMWLQFPEQVLPSLRCSDADQIERAAERSRMQWGLGLDVPITNMTRVLENAGIPVTRFEGLSDKIDAFSWFGPNRSFVVLNDKTPSRSRWDMAHECGHLVMHGGTDVVPDDIEQQAHRFAGAFLLPRSGFEREFPGFSRRTGWEPLLRFKDRWRVSLAATIRRAFDLRLIDAVDYRGGYQALSILGWLRQEPHEPPAEEPELLTAAFRELSSIGKSPNDLASELGWANETLTRVAGTRLPTDAPEPPTSTGTVIPFSRDARRSA